MGNSVERPLCAKKAMQGMIEQQSIDDMKISKGKSKKSIRNIGTHDTDLSERRMTNFSDFNNRISHENIYEVYKFGKVLGNGKFGIVRIACRLNDDK